jgi:DNA-binding NarL/FixJ family response regulator
MRLIQTETGELAQLSPRERQVGELLALGMSNKAIGFRLQISPHTVKGRIAGMREKLKLDNRVQLALWIHCHPKSLTGLAVPVALALPAELTA